MLKTDGLGPLLDVQMSFGVAGARGSVHCQESVFVACPSRRGAFEDDLGRCISRGRRGTRDMLQCSSEILGLGTDFLRGIAFWSIRSSGLLR